MAKFNPNTTFDVPFLANRSQGQIPNKAGGILAAGLGTAVEQGVKAEENRVQSNIQNELSGARDQLFKEFGVDKVIEGASGDFPSAIQNTQRKFQTLQDQLTQGAISEVDFYTRAGALAKQVRSKYPQWRPEIDQMTKSIFGFDPANQVMNELFAAQRAGQSSAEKEANRIYGDINEEANRKRIALDPSAKVLYDKFIDTGDIETGRKLQKKLTDLAVEQARHDRFKRNAERRAEQGSNVKEEVTGLVVTDLNRSRRRAVHDSISAIAEKMGIEGGTTSLLQFFLHVSADGISTEERETLIQLKAEIGNAFRFHADSIASTQFNDGERERGYQQILGGDFNSLVDAEVTQLNGIIDGVLGSKMDLAPLLMDSIVTELESDEAYRDFLEKFPQAKSAEFLKQAFGEDFMSLIMQQLRDNDPEAYTKFKRFLDLSVGLLSSELNEVPSVPEIVDHHNKDTEQTPKEKARDVTNFLGTLGQITSGNSPLDEDKSRQVARNVFDNMTPSEFFKQFPEGDNSRLIALEKIASPSTSDWIASKFKGTTTWENYKTFVVDSLSQLPGSRLAVNDLKQHMSQQSDRIGFEFDENTFQFSMEVKPHARADVQGAFSNRIQKSLDRFNAYFRLLEPIAEAEGQDSTKFLLDTFNKLQIDHPLIEHFSSSLQSKLDEQEGNTDLEKQSSTRAESVTTGTTEVQLVNLVDSDLSSLEGEPEQIADIITVPEGTSGPQGYDTILANSQDRFGVKPTQMTLDEVIAFQSPRGEYAKFSKQVVGRIATPVGRYQIVGKTLRSLKKQLGLSGEEVFSPELQDRLFLALLEGRGYSKFKSGGMDEIDFIKNVSKEWEGVKLSRDARRKLMRLL